MYTYGVRVYFGDQVGYIIINFLVGFVFVSLSFGYLLALCLCDFGGLYLDKS